MRLDISSVFYALVCLGSILHTARGSPVPVSEAAHPDDSQLVPVAPHSGPSSTALRDRPAPGSQQGVAPSIEPRSKAIGLWYDPFPQYSLEEFGIPRPLEPLLQNFHKAGLHYFGNHFQDWGVANVGTLVSGSDALCPDSAMPVPNKGLMLLYKSNFGHARTLYRVGFTMLWLSYDPSSQTIDRTDVKMSIQIDSTVQLAEFPYGRLNPDHKLLKIAPRTRYQFHDFNPNDPSGAGIEVVDTEPGTSGHAHRGTKRDSGGWFGDGKRK
ncbi:hypothetical protein F5878DRAFT_618290 [Lentinula raphanica]|uniref:Uncharacterized protein n=1 Tax=Lentinula raphanica TaxID=153919 RepID=A0AA38P9X2_9AGAR|nr:hypothetical protein EV360DRAFT_86845 [Lentinula raphanica]KAJ3838856.1 hypothetical protein F5878DRAFT_618290 [Lentinula raphanica]